MKTSEYQLDLQSYKNSKNHSIMMKVESFQNELVKHDRNRLFLLRKSPLTTPNRECVNLMNYYTQKEEEEFLMFASNNYLGISDNSEIKDKTIAAVADWGVGAGSVPLLGGTTCLHKRLEKQISLLKGFEDTLLFSSGFSANIGVISGLIRSSNLVLHDRLNHASLIDGTILSGAKMIRYKHADASSLEKNIRENHKLFPGGILIVTDGVFSMDGDIAPIPSIIEIARKYNAILLIDDAHATGVIGERGEGSLAHFNVSDKENIIVVGSLSKALGGIGGFVSAEKKIIDYLRVYARSSMYSTALPPANCASSIEAIKYMLSSSIVKKLQENCEYLKNKLKEYNFSNADSKSAIFPIIVRDERKLTELSYIMYKNRILLNYIYPPVVPMNLSRIRLSVMASHTFSEIDMVVRMLVQSRKKIGNF